MEVSSQDPSLVAMDLSKSYKPLTRSHTEAMDLVKKPEWYHRRPAGCSADITVSSFRSRASSSSFNSLSAAPAPAAVHCRDMDQRPEALTGYMNSSITPGLDLYHDGVHGNLWHQGFYGPDRSGGPAPESSGAEESDSSSDVIFLVSSAKEPLLCSSFIQDSVRHIVEPLSPPVSSLGGGRDCCHLPQPLSSPSADSSYSDDSSDSSVDIPVHHTRPVVLLSDLGSVYGNRVQSLNVSSDDSDVIEVSVTNCRKRSRSFSRKKTVPCKKSDMSDTSPQSGREKAPAKKVRRSTRIRKPVSETPQFSCAASRYSLRRQAKNDAVGIYNESCDSDDMMDYTARLSSPEVDESLSPPNESQRASSSHESDVDALTERTSPPPRGKPTSPAKKPLTTTKRLRGTKQKQQNLKASPANKKNTTRRKKKRRTCSGPSSLFPPREPEIKLRYAKLKAEKKAKKSDAFCPFVHVEQRTCTVVNFEEEEATVRSSRGARTQIGVKSLPGSLPKTSCFRLSRLRSESRSQGALSCSLCGQMANLKGLGDLHGPYCRSSSRLDVQSCRTVQKEEDCSRTLADSVNSPDISYNSRACSPAVTCSQGGDSSALPKIRLQEDECWIHEDCGIWSTGVFLVRGKLYGLEEAARLAQETVCSACQQTGAIMGCFQKGCSRNYHYICAIHSGCALNEENFSMRCTEHKNKAFTSITRRRRR
ncbi:transcription factor 20-like [Solea senegalensis]|uniref:Transcription factor 20-like n=1 Tax=Solea senegalensis TaxID=28829 RepID=A0AAV6RNF3_SOLSE|nr:transcription factor 20-like [Solea senegalensis]